MLNDVEKYACKWHFYYNPSKRAFIVLPRLKCLVLLKLGQWFWRRRFQKFRQWISLFIWKKSWPFIETNLTLCVLCQVWLRLVQWFWRRRLKCEKFMITTTTTKTEILIRKALEPLSSSYKPVYQIMLCVERKPHGFRQWLKHSWVKGIQVCSSEKQCRSIIEDNSKKEKMKYHNQWKIRIIL